MSDKTAIATTRRLILRPGRADEAARFYDMHRRVEVARGIGTSPMRSQAEALAVIERCAARLAADARFGSWAIVEQSSGVPAGTVLLQPLPDGDGEIEIGWHLHPDAWGRGLATEAAKALVAYAAAGSLDEVWALTHLDNTRSANVCRRLGMRRARVHRDAAPRS